MNFTEDSYKLLYDVQKKCNELNQKIDSIIRIMEMLTTYMQYSSMMPDMSDLFHMFHMQNQSGEGTDPDPFSPPPMNAAKNSNQQMSQEEFNQIFETLKQGKSPEEVARMEQMVQLAKSFMQ